MKILRVILALVILFNTAFAQTDKPAYWDDIQAFKKKDSASFPGTGKILFVGSSSFTKWTDVQEYFPSFPIINRGFGGSTLLDVIRYEKEIIFPYNPKQIVIYCGENDIANDSTVTGKMVFKRFKKLYRNIHRYIGYVPLLYISMKPSPSRWHLREKMMEGNRLIQNFLERQSRHVQFISVWDAMLGPDGKPKDEIFIEDKLHMNSKGYLIWQRLIEPYLLK